MKTGELAQILTVDRGTILNWAENPLIAEFLSPGAKGEHGTAHRIYSEADVLVFNTIRHFRTSGITDWKEIARNLDSGERNQEFPQNAIALDPRTVPIGQAEQSARALATVAERDVALQRVNELENEIERLRREHKEELAKERLRSDELQDKIANLNREIGRLEATVTILKEQSKD